MEASHKKKGKRPNLLADTVFSWSIDDVLNERLFKNKVEKIPESFQSVEHYFGCYVYPLLEETRAQVHSSMETIHRAPYAKVVSFENAKPYGRKLYNVKVDYWRNRFNDRGKEPYKTLPGDLFVLANAKLETVSDLQRLGRSWAFGSVTKVSENENKDDTTSLYFKVKASKELKVLKSTTPLFMVFLVNLIPNGRIWKALHMSKNLKIVKEVLCTDNVAQKSVCSEKNSDIVNMGLVQSLSSGLSESQTGTVLACLEMLHSRDKSAVELIWGPPGTGKTKTIVTLLLSLLQMNCRTLVCAPTNVAITEIASRLVKMVTEVESNAPYCSLGKVLLFGNKERLKIGSDIEEIYLDFRLKRLVECLGPQTGWRHCFTSMIECLEDGVSHYRTFLGNGLTIEKELKTTGQMQVKESRIVTKVGKDKCKTFLEFIRDRFVSIASPLRYCISIFCTHMAKNHISADIFQSMVSLVNLVDSFESLLFQGNVAPEALEDIFSRSDVEDISETCVDNSFLLFTNRRECLKVLHKLFDSLRKLDLPDFMKQESLMAFCFQKCFLDILHCIQLI
uniref:helicase sen1-like n=1 Tax=Fragaria vesca subsp. vesca TaxID=101020 RepID=UPI0005CA5287|nr:PREDICTED: helicase sen1-like [Fragaria vesca subsp. vesca]